jgi:hypothetical protein
MAILARREFENYGAGRGRRERLRSAYAFLALNNAPSVNFEVAMPVGPAYSGWRKPAPSRRARRSRTETAPPTQSDHASRLFATFSGSSSFSTMSAN